MVPYLLRLGLIGAGPACENLHIPALLRLTGTIAVTAVADTDAERARRAAGRFPGARACDSAARLIVAADIDAVAILTPPSTHAALAMAALHAGKHVLVEKPLATTSEDAEALARAARLSGRCAAAGHNLRFHRLVQRARAALASGALGELVVIGATWTSPGSGGVLLDLGVHHVDLARFLTGSEFAEVAAVAAGDGRASVSARLRNGVLFSAAWAKDAATGHSIRLSGTRATIEFSPYRANSWRLLPEGAAGARAHLHEAVEYLSQLPDIAAAMRTGGDSAESYRLEWLDFARAVADGRPPACPFEEAALNVEVCRAMIDAAATGTRVAFPVAAPEEEPPPETGPALSVILGAHESYGTVRRTVRHLRAQTLRSRIEFILVAVADKPLDVPPGDLEGFFATKLLTLAPGVSVAAANTAGTHAASAPVVAFAEDHCYPEPGWAAALVEAHTRGYAAVGPEIANANPGSIVSWCDYLIGYGFWMSPCQAGEAPFLPGHNSSYKRDELLAYGESLEAMLESETVLHFDLTRRGRKLYLEPRARAAHLNFALWGVWLPVQFLCGRMFAGSRAADWGVGRKLFYAAASPLIPAVRAARLCRELLKPDRPRRMIPRLLPVLSVGLVLDGLGQLIGYLAGPGASAGRLAEYEYDRVRYIRPEDRRALEEADERSLA